MWYVINISALSMIWIYCTDQKGCYFLRQHSLTSVESYCEHWNIKVSENKTQTICFSCNCRWVWSHLILNGSNIPFVNKVKYLTIIFDMKMTLRIHIKVIKTKAFRTFCRCCFLFRIEWLNANIELTFHNALIRSLVTYTCIAWEFVADTYLWKLQLLQNMGLCAIGNCPKCTSMHELHVASKILYVHDFITKLCRQQASSHKIMKLRMSAT